MRVAIDDPWNLAEPRFHDTSTFRAAVAPLRWADARDRAELGRDGRNSGTGPGR